MIRAFHLASALVLPLFLAGQSLAAAAPSPSNPQQPSDSTPAADPARPTVSNPAHIPPVGYLQFEQGVLWAGASPDGLSHQTSIVQTTKLSVHPRLMIQFESEPFAASRVTDTSGPVSSRDTGDLLAGAQVVLAHASGARPAVAVAYNRRFREGTAADLDIGGSSQSGAVLVSGDLGQFHYDSNFLANEQTQDATRRGQFGQTVSITHDLLADRFSDKVELTGEIWHFTQPLVEASSAGSIVHRANAVGVLWALGYSLRPNLVFDAGFDRGLTSTSTHWQGFGGLTYLLPHRLWPDHAEGSANPHHGHIHRR